MFERLGDASRRARFNGLKHRLGEQELRWLATVGPNHHVLVAYVDGDPQPVAIARLVRSGASAEVAFEVADAYQGRGIGSALTQELVSDACAAGIVEVTALVRSDNPRGARRPAAARSASSSCASRARRCSSGHRCPRVC